MDIRDSLMESLRDAGYGAVGAANGRDAMETLRAGQRPCLILLDLMMPLMDGRQFREEQLQNPQLADIPVVVISADHRVAEKTRSVKATEFLAKPIRLKALLAVTSRYCREAKPAD